MPSLSTRSINAAALRRRAIDAARCSPYNDGFGSQFPRPRSRTLARPRLTFWIVALPALALSCSSSETSNAPAPPAQPVGPEAVPLLLVDQAATLIPDVAPVRGLHAAFHDLDGDGHPDIAQPTSEGPLVYWGGGSTPFEAALPSAVPQRKDGYATLALAADFDADGFGDLLLFDSEDPPLRLLTHKTARSFEAVEVDLREGLVPLHAISVDLEGDGDLDVVATLSPDSVVGASSPLALVLVNDGTGTLTDQTSSRLAAPELTAFGVAAGDVDGDGTVDLFFAGDTSGHRLMLNDGQGHFRDAAPDAIPAFDAPGGRIPTMAKSRHPVEPTTIAVSPLSDDQLEAPTDATSRKNLFRSGGDRKGTDLGDASPVAP